MTPAPLVVTLLLDDAAQDRFDAERHRWFPPGRTAVGAHVTLFHALPGELHDVVLADLHAQSGPSFEVVVNGLRSLGRGVAYTLDSAELNRRHAALQQGWWPHLTRQDRQPFHPHVTVQNKVTPSEARHTLAVLQGTFAPFTLQALGFALWRYDGGPWTSLARAPFGLHP